MKQFATRFGLPYTSLITVFGLFLGIYSDYLGRIGHAIRVWSQFDPHLLLLIFLPALIFESAFNSDWHIFKVEFAQVLMMAGPMLLLSTFMSALMMKYILGYSGSEFPFSASLLFGSIISATDPVAVVCLLKELGASKRLSTMIEGESLLNDGTAMVVFLVVLDIVEGKETTVSDIFLKFIRLSLGGPLLGIICGIIVTIILRRIHNNFVLEVNTTIFACYVMFYVAESTAVHVSGILALVALGLYMTKSGKTRISAESEHSVHHIWGYFGFIAETTIFILTGIIMGDRASHDENVIKYQDYLKMVASYVMLHFIRFFCIFVCWPFLSRMGYGMTFKEVLLCSYAGLRGAVGMSLALMVAASKNIPRYI
jgi:NhaP-type Na+/H+ or K+/H+ antiporter